MKPSEIMTWAGPLPPDLMEAEDPSEGQEAMTFAGPVAPVEDEPAVRIDVAVSETIFWAGPLPPEDWEIPSRRIRNPLNARTARAEAKA